MKNRKIISIQKEIPSKGVKFCLYKICDDSDFSPFLKLPWPFRNRKRCKSRLYAAGPEEGEQPGGKSCRFSLDQIEGWPTVEELEDLLHGLWQENVL